MHVAVLEEVLQQLKANMKWMAPLPFRLPAYGRVLDAGLTIQLLSLEEQGMSQVGHFLCLAREANLSLYLPKDAAVGQICLCYTELISPRFFVLGWTGAGWEWLDYELLQPVADYQTMSLNSLLMSDRL